jgi:nucleoid-associated protein YgaU
VALTGTIGAAVLVVALGLFYAIYQQDQDEGTDAAPVETAPVDGSTTGEGGASGDGTGAAPAEGQQAATGTTGTGATATGTGTSETPAQSAAPAADAAAGAQPVPPSFDVVRVNPSGDTVIAGRAEPGAEVTILDRGKVLGSVEADGRGEWVFLPEAALNPGEHSFSLESAGGDTPKQESDTNVVVIVPEVAKDIAGRATDQPAGALAIEVPKSGEGPTRVLNVPNSGSASTGAAPAGPEIAAIDYNAEGRAVLSGRAPSGARLFVYVDNKPAGEVVANEDGAWSFTPKEAIAPGLHVIRIDQVDESGKVLARAETPFEQATFPLASESGSQTVAASGEDAAGGAQNTAAMAGGTIVVQPGNTLWRLARESYGAGVRYTVIYEANKEQIANPNLIYPGQVFSVPAEN